MANSDRAEKWPPLIFGPFMRKLLLDGNNFIYSLYTRYSFFLYAYSYMHPDQAV